MTRIVINENKSVYVDGYRHILKYDEDEIVLKLSKKQLHIKGNELTITSFCNTEFLITGNIMNICFEKD